MGHHWKSSQDIREIIRDSNQVLWWQKGDGNLYPIVRPAFAQTVKAIGQPGGKTGMLFWKGPL